VKTLRAAIYHRHGGPEEIAVENLPLPEPAAGQVLVRLSAAGVAPLDWKLRAGLLRDHFSLTFPKIPGRDGAGTIIACGEGVHGFSASDRVAVMAPPMGQAGTYAEAIAVEARHVVPVPQDLDTIEAASLVNAGLSALIAVERTADVQAGQRVLVISGAGAVGGLMVQLCAAKGAIVTALCRSTNADYVRSLGAERAIAYDGPFPTDLPPQDVVFDLMGGATHDACYPLLAPGGHLVWLTAAPITDRGAAYGVRVSRAQITDDAGVVAKVLDLAAQGVLRSQIAARLPLAQAADAQRRLEAGEISRGRLILEME
jgi:NADPH:quinone reductase-like Zn-dependent oxidoreductase